MRRAARGVEVEFAELSDPGRDPTKQINEDSCGFAESPLGLLSVVCDGMGGHSAGREASTAGVRTIIAELSAASAEGEPGPALKQAVEAAGRAVYAVGGDAPHELRPGSTCVALLLHERGLEVAHVGDSRAYLVRAGGTSRLTRDHSMVQQMIDAGVLDEDSALDHPDAGKITRALGMSPDVEVELGPEPLRVQAGDVLILCSDGLTDLVGDDEIAELTTALGETPQNVAEELVGLANARGGYDNITVQVIRILRVPQHQTVVMGETLRPTRAGVTVVDDPVPETARPQPGHRAPPSPTILDEEPQRTTLPGAAPGARQHTGSLPPAIEKPSGVARTVVLLTAGLTALMLLGVGVWWIASALKKPDPADLTPPPPPTTPTTPTTPTAPPTQIEPLELPDADVAPSAVPAADAAPPSKDSGSDAAKPDAGRKDAAAFP